MALSDVDLKIDLHSECDKFFDLLKAAIRDWRNGWRHEQERANYALQLYQRSLEIMKVQLEEARKRAEGGFFTDMDQKILNHKAAKLEYWENKLQELR
ncbi:MAG: hypothetical protein PWP31_103 [Clostridia bacterium]|nr:hypothetical protein [Clostridia bacterium]